jgi:hypothetical protein
MAQTATDADGITVTFADIGGHRRGRASCLQRFAEYPTMLSPTA